MSTEKQIEANRLNATKSTGPTTDEGKSAVRFNALKHGLFAESTVVKGEDAAAFDALRDSYVQRWQPAAPEEETLVTNLIRYTWLLDRFSKIERHIWNFRLDAPAGDFPVPQAHTMAFKELDYLQRRLNAAHRNYRCDVELLTRLQAARKLGRDAPGAAPEPEPESTQPVPPAIGFDPPNPQEPPKIPAFPPSAATHPQPLAVPVQPNSQPLPGGMEPEARRRRDKI